MKAQKRRKILQNEVKSTSLRIHEHFANAVYKSTCVCSERKKIKLKQWKKLMIYKQL